MGRSPCCAKEGLNRGAWTAIEDKILIEYIKTHGEGKWRHLPKRAGLKRCGKSCRLRWLNYLRPDIKRGNITLAEEDLIIRLHKLLGNRWSLIAGRLPGRTDNEIKNYWNTNIGKKLQNANSKFSNTTSGCGGTSGPDPDPDPRPKTPPEMGSSLVRTKATRCTKVIVSEEMKPLMAAPSLPHYHGTMNPSEHEKLDSETPPFGNSLDFMAEFGMDEDLFSDLLNMDISEPSCLEKNTVVVDESNASTSDQALHHLSPPTSNDTHLNVSDDSLHGSEDLQSMSALMENEFDWL